MSYLKRKCEHAPHSHTMNIVYISNLLISLVTNNKSMQLYVAGLPTMNVVHLKPIHVTI